MKKLLFIFLLNTCCNAMNVTYSKNSIDQQGVTILKHNVDIDAPFQITTSNATLDMNGKTIRGGILIAQGLRNIIIKNGIVDPITTTTQAAIYAQTGCENIQLINLKIRNAQSGILFDEVSKSTIGQCEISGTSTAILMQSCNAIIVDNLLAQNNTNCGVCLLSSFTCVIKESKAINTGIDNTAGCDTTVFGFVSSNGSGNIFERCIANATQALSTTDFNSVVAGIALRGTEHCTKIIECEASNATTSAQGVTIPYGILLESFSDGIMTRTAVPAIPAVENIEDLAWSPDEKYLATGATDASNSKKIHIFYFDHANNILSEVAMKI